MNTINYQKIQSVTPDGPITGTPENLGELVARIEGYVGGILASLTAARHDLLGLADPTGSSAIPPSESIVAQLNRLMQTAGQAAQYADELRRVVSPPTPAYNMLPNGAAERR